MRILLATHFFFPNIGGLETVARVLADQFTALGHQVIVMTQSPRPDGEALDREEFAYPVVRCPDAKQTLRLVRWCEVYFQNNISLRTLWPLLLARRPWVVSHQTWLTRVNGRTGWEDILKKQLIRFGSPIAISRAVAAPLPVPATLIGNPYQNDLFRVLPDVERTKDIVFLARLVSDKGGDVTLEALARMRLHGLTPRLTVVGDGPERPNLEALAQRLGVASQVTFLGMQTGETLVRILNEHRVMAVPSLLAEPFGVVALEGIACGCAVVASEGGGLPDAIGPCGLLFPNGDANALADCLGRLLIDGDLRDRLRAGAAEHLAAHSPQRIAAKYLEMFEKARR
ncbi:MAG: glycosyltransferase family 4 protein [Gluconacetobacter diazotrophicus]|nr:glycosyltransferase family 4 protein [Gluconacetobacter diazotrophicus]